AACPAEDGLASVIEVLDELADGNPDSQAGHGKVMTPQPKQRHADQDREDGGRKRSQREGEEERPPRPGDEHPGRVGADAEESHVAEGRVAGETADDVPGGRHDGEHRGDRGQAEPELVGEQRHVEGLRRLERSERGEHRVREHRQRETDEDPVPQPRAGNGDHRSRPIKPCGRVTRTRTMTPKAIALAKTDPEPGIDWPNASMRPKARPPTTVALTRPRPPRITTTKACSVYGSPAVGVIAWIIAMRPPATPAHAAPRP